MNYWIFAGLANAVLALVPGTLALLCQWRGGHARLVRALWIVALVKLLTPPVVGLPVGWLGETVTAAATSRSEAIAMNAVTPGGGEISVVMKEVKPQETAAPATRVTPEPATRTNESAAISVPAPASSGGEAHIRRAMWEEIIGVVWCGGSTLVFAWGVYHIGKFRRLAQHAQEGSAGIRAMAERVGARLGLRRLPKILLLDERMSPVLWGLALRPRILLPRGLCEGLTQREQEALLAHELAHFGRGDHWVRWLEFVTQVLYWWHPLVWAGARQMRRAEEEATDGAVVSALPEHAADYARALLAVVDLVAGTRWRVPAGGSGMSEFSDLTRRMEMIMKPTKRTMNWTAWAVFAAGSLALMPVLPVGGAGASAEPTPAMAAADPMPTQIAQATAAPVATTPQGSRDEAQKKLEDERKRMEDERKKYEDARRQMEEARRKVADHQQQEQAVLERGRVADATAVKLRELELSEFMDTGKNITTARLEADMRSQLAQARALEAKWKRVSEAVKNGVVTNEEATDVEVNLETARANADIARLELESWQKYGIEKKQLQLQQQLEEAERNLAARRWDANPSSANTTSSSATQSPVAP